MPLKGLKVVSDYGCQMVRPPRITGFADYENPQTLDRIMKAIGATALDWSYKATCCGAGIGIGRRDIRQKLYSRLILKARSAGAEAVVVSCPLCQSNLDWVQREMEISGIPVFYFTELMRLAFEAKDFSLKRFRSHFTDPVPLLTQKTFPRAVPLKYAIDPENCLYLAKKRCGLCKKICPVDAVDFDQEPESFD